MHRELSPTLPLDIAAGEPIGDCPEDERRAETPLDERCISGDESSLITLLAADSTRSAILAFLAGDGSACGTGVVNHVQGAQHWKQVPQLRPPCAHAI